MKNKLKQDHIKVSWWKKIDCMSNRKKERIIDSLSEWMCGFKLYEAKQVETLKNSHKCDFIQGRRFWKKFSKEGMIWYKCLEFKV